jgi:hypothetical protein
MPLYIDRYKTSTPTHEAHEAAALAIAFIADFVVSRFGTARRLSA